MNKEAFSHYKLGIPEIDEQHWLLCEKLDNALFNRDCRSKQDYVRLVDDLKDSILFHFNSEETFMRGINFPFFDFHKKSMID